MSRIEFEFRRTQIINPGWIDSDAELNSAEIHTLKHIMTEQNRRFVIISAFDSAHVPWVRRLNQIKAGPQPLFPAEPGVKKLLSWSELDRPF